MTERGPAQVLLVEDNAADVRLFREALSHHASDVQLHVVENGVDALKCVRREGAFSSATAPDLIILDFNLPGKDGREVLRELKGDRVLRRIPVVVLTTAGGRKRHRSGIRDASKLLHPQTHRHGRVRAGGKGLRSLLARGRALAHAMTRAILEP